MKFVIGCERIVRRAAEERDRRSSYMEPEDAIVLSGKRASPGAKKQRPHLLGAIRERLLLPETNK